MANVMQANSLRGEADGPIDVVPCAMAPLVEVPRDADLVFVLKETPARPATTTVGQAAQPEGRVYLSSAVRRLSTLICESEC
eukprot:m.77037 g.77037  ORF g.77037 m.77037 type:complete len:82 (-) comp50477_c0_seq3:239-484(-)